MCLMIQDRRIEKTRTAIREAFFSLVKERDMSKITITEIARRANINRKTFYLHYDSTEAILDEFCKELIKKLLPILEKNDFFDRSFDVASLFQSLNMLMEKDIDLYRHIAHMPAYAFLWEQIKDILKSTVKETMADKLIVSPEEFELYAEFYSAGTIAAYLKWLREEVDLSEEELVNVLGNATYYGFQKLLPYG